MPSYNNNREEIKNRLDIVDVISEYVPLKKSGQNWKGLCPFHAEKTPSFMVSPSKQIYHCFGCASGGDIFTFLMKFDTLSFQESLQILAKKAGVTLKNYPGQKVAAGLRENLINIHKDANTFYKQNLKIDSPAEKYLAGRGITGEIREHFSIGYAPNSWNALHNYLQKRGHKIDAIKRAGLAVQGSKGTYDTFRNRIIFPIFDPRGEVIAFGGRVMDDSLPKYLNSPETAIFSKSRVLYGLNAAKEEIKKTGFIILAEGYMDVITLHMKGFSNAAAPLGTALTQEHGKLIKRYTQDAVIVFDGDASGVKAAKNGIGVLFESGINVKIMPMPAGEDPDSLIMKKGKQTFGKLLNDAVSIVDFFVMQKGDVHIIAGEALEMILRIPNSVLQGSYVKMLAERLKINEMHIREEFSRINKSRQTRQSYQNRHVSSEKSSSALKAASGTNDEDYLLQLILMYPAKARHVFDAVSEEDMEYPVKRSIYMKMKNGSIGYDELISECSDEERNLLTELSLKSEFMLDSESGDPEKLFRDCVKRIMFKRRRVLLDNLQDRIRNAEREKNHSLLKTLQMEHQKLLKMKSVT